jgi:hypothetical protein
MHISKTNMKFLRSCNRTSARRHITLVPNRASFIASAYLLPHLEQVPIYNLNLDNASNATAAGETVLQPKTRASTAAAACRTAATPTSSGIVSRIMSPPTAGIRAECRPSDATETCSSSRTRSIPRSGVPSGAGTARRSCRVTRSDPGDSRSTERAIPEPERRRTT